MNKIFLSFHYDEPNKQLARSVEDLVESHSVRAVTGNVLGGQVLTPELQQQIAEADALIALLTRRDKLQGGGWTTHEFCKNELQHARTIGKPAIALVETGVDVSGLYKEHEYIAYDSADPLPAFLKLSRTIWLWKSRAGRTVKIQVVPDDVAQEIWATRDRCEWEYRLSSGLRETDWLKAKARKEPGGLYLYVQIPDDTMLIEVRIKGVGKAWASDATPLSFPLPVSEQK